MAARLTQLLALFAACLLFPVNSIASDASPAIDQQVELYFFWSPTCPHCRNAHAFLDTLPQRAPWISLRSFNLRQDRANVLRYQQMAAAVGQQAQSVPAFFICGAMYAGWDSPEGQGQHLLDVAAQCRENSATPEATSTTLQVPVLGALAMDDYSLPLFTLIIAGLDAFNPCAFFVLLFLLSLLVHARSRRRMLLIGGTFVLISGVVYFLFMAAWLNLFLMLGSLPWITLGAGLVAFTIGLLAVKDFVTEMRGPSLSIPDRAKPKLFNRMRGLLASDKLPTLMLGTIALAVVANSYELLCTAGFPMVYTRALTLHSLSEMDYYLYLVFYNVIYVVPLMVIVGLFTATLGARKLSMEEGRLLKLLSGTMMLGLGLVLLLKPEWLSSALTGLLLLLGAVVVCLLGWLYLRYKNKMTPRENTHK